MNHWRLFILCGFLLASMQSNAQVLTEWVQSKAPGETNKIALGYPVPIPVNSPLP